MELKGMNCPKCGAELHFDDEQDFCFCSHCGTQVYKDNPNNASFTYKDVGKIKETELKGKVFDNLKVFLTPKMILKVILIGLGILLFIVFLVGIFYGKDAVADLFGMLAIFAMLIGMGWFLYIMMKLDKK